MERGVEFLQFRSGAAGRHARPADGLADIDDAHRLHQQADLATWEVQARLLAGEPFDAIAAKTGLPQDVVEAFHELHFEVRPRLGAFVYVLGVAIGGTRVFPHPRPEDHETLLKVVGHAWGPHGVDALLDLWSHPPVVPRSLDGLALTDLQDLRRRLRLQLALRIFTTPASAVPPAVWMTLREHLAGSFRNPAAGCLPDLADILDLVELGQGLQQDAVPDAIGAEPLAIKVA